MQLWHGSAFSCACVQHRGAGGDWVRAGGSRTNRSPAFFSSSCSVVPRIRFLNLQLRVFLCTSLEVQFLLDFCGPDLTLLSERQMPHDHRDFTLPTDLCYYYVGKDFGGAGESLKDHKELSQQKKKELEKPKQPIPSQRQFNTIRM